MNPAARLAPVELEVDAGRRRRADWSLSRQRILHAANEVFSERGYRRTNTAELAEAAGVAEATLFRHFPTKAQLFEQAVIAPLRQSVADLAESRRRHPPTVSAGAATYTFYDEVVRMLRRDARLLIAALAVLTFEEETAEFEGLTGAFSELLDYLDEAFQTRASERDLRVDPAITVRAMVATALGLALGERLLFRDDDKPDHERLVSELAKLAAFGLPGRPAAE